MEVNMIKTHYIELSKELIKKLKREELDGIAYVLGKLINNYITKENEGSLTICIMQCITKSYHH